MKLERTPLALAVALSACAPEIIQEKLYTDPNAITFPVQRVLDACTNIISHAPDYCESTIDPTPCYAYHDQAVASLGTALEGWQNKLSPSSNWTITGYRRIQTTGNPETDELSLVLSPGHEGLTGRFISCQLGENLSISRYHDDDVNTANILRSHGHMLQITDVDIIWSGTFKNLHSFERITTRDGDAIQVSNDLDLSFNKKETSYKYSDDCGSKNDAQTECPDIELSDKTGEEIIETARILIEELGLDQPEETEISIVNAD